MTRKIFYFIGTLLLFITIFTAGIDTKTCRAASAEITISSDSAEIKAGDTFHVFIDIESDTVFGNFEANLTYDNSLIKYSGGPSVISGGNGFLSISDMNVSEGDSSRRYSLEFEALKVGKATIEFYGDIMVYDYDTDIEMPVSSNVFELEVSPAQNASKEARLKTMQVYPAGLNPEFDPNTYEYNLNVGNDTQQLVITAIPYDSKATVSISGNDFLNEGDNNVVVSVLSETGDIIEYKIKVYREPAVQDQAPDKSDDQTKLEDYFELTEEDGRTYALFASKYEIIEPADDVVIPEGYKPGSLTVSGITISAYIPEDNDQSEFVLIYARNEYGDKGFYKYDRIEKTLQRYVEDNMIISNNQKANNNGVTEDNGNMTKAVFVIILLCGICILMTFITVRMYIKLKGYKEDDLD